MNFSDWIGSIGVTILLIAFVLILTNKISKSGVTYLFMNLSAAYLRLLHLILYIIFRLLFLRQRGCLHLFLEYGRPITWEKEEN